MSFQALGLHPDILKGIAEMGFENPTPIQEQGIPPILKGQDVIASAQTGSGKTAAFVLPTLHRLMTTPRVHAEGIRALFLSPTRELALQSMEQLKNLSRFVHQRGHAIFGGVPMEPQISMLKQGLDIVSATPGRLLDHVYEGRINFSAIEIVVLDEADRMMDMGFLPDVSRIISFLPPKRQTLIFSATIPDAILKLSKDITHDPVRIQVGSQTTTIASGITHVIYPVPGRQKTQLLLKLLQGHDVSSTIIFVRTKQGADHLTRDLERHRIRAAVIHGDRSQMERERALRHFKDGRVQVLVATDIAARGIDIKDISHVINYDMPFTPEDYVHRVGRTGRAEATGDAFSLVSADEAMHLEEIEKLLGYKIEKVLHPDFNYEKDEPRSSSRSARPHRPSSGGGRSGGRSSGGSSSRSSHARPRR